LQQGSQDWDFARTVLHAHLDRKCHPLLVSAQQQWRLSTEGMLYMLSRLLHCSVLFGFQQTFTSHHSMRICLGQLGALLNREASAGGCTRGGSPQHGIPGQVRLQHQPQHPRPKNRHSRQKRFRRGRTVSASAQVLFKGSKNLRTIKSTRTTCMHKRTDLCSLIRTMRRWESATGKHRYPPSDKNRAATMLSWS